MSADDIIDYIKTKAREGDALSAVQDLALDLCIATASCGHLMKMPRRAYKKWVLAMWDECSRIPSQTQFIALALGRINDVVVKLNSMAGGDDGT